MKKRILSMLLAVVMAVGALPGVVVTAAPAPAPSGSSGPAPSGPSIAMYSSQVRDESTKLSNPQYYRLENGTVWVMCEEGFTEAQKSTITAEVYEWGITHDPIVPAWVARPGTEERYDVKITLPKPQQINMTYELTVKDGRNSLGQFSIDTGFTKYEANGLYIGDYVVGFSTTNDVTGIVTVYEKTTIRIGDSSQNISDSYQLFGDIDISVAEIKYDESGRKYYDPVTDRRAKVTVSKVWIEHFYGPEAFSLSNKEHKTEITPDTVNDWELYFKSGDRSVVKLWATVSMTVNGQTVTGDIGSATFFCIDSVEKTYDCAQMGIDTVEELNAFLVELAEELDKDSTTIIPDAMAQTRQVTYVQLADVDYTGTVLIPDKFRELSLTPVVLRGSGNTRLIGNMIVGDPGVVNGGAHVDVEDVCFIAPEETGNGESIAISGDYASVRRCVFYGYDAAINWTQDGGVILPNQSVFINNGAAIRVNAGSRMNTGTLDSNTFINNETAVQLISGFSPYYFRVTNSNFINNGTDFDVYTEGTLYQYQNYFAQFCERGNGHVPMPGLPHADRYNDCENLGLSAMLAATTEASVGNLLKRRPAQVDTNAAGARVITNPHWKFPVTGWWSGDIPLESVILGRSNAPAVMRMRLLAGGAYENVLIADWSAETQILNEEANTLIIDSSAFDEAGVKEIRVVDSKENTVGTWLFADQTNVMHTFRLLRTAALTDDFNAKLIVAYADESDEEFTVTVGDSSIFSAKRPYLTMPYDLAGAVITGPDGVSQVAAASGGQISFRVAMGGTYTVSPAKVEFTVTFDPDNGEKVFTESVLYGGTVAQPVPPKREGYVFLGWTADGVDAVEFPFAALEDVTFTAMWEEADDTANWLLWLAMLYGQTFDVNAAATEGGTVTPAGITEVKYGKDVTYTITPDAGYVIADVLVDGVSVGAVSEYAFANVKNDHTLTAVFKLKKVFDDVPTDADYYDAVMYLYEKGSMIGTGGATFDPDGTLTRGMLVTILWRLSGEPVVNYAMSFTDVPAEEYYTEAVRWAAGTKLVQGWENAFRPDDAITREELAAVLHRYVKAEGEPAETTQYKHSDWSKDAVLWAEGTGLLTGIPADLTADATRAVAALMVWRIVK